MVNGTVEDLYHVLRDVNTRTRVVLLLTVWCIWCIVWCRLNFCCMNAYVYVHSYSKGSQVRTENIPCYWRGLS